MPGARLGFGYLSGGVSGKRRREGDEDASKLSFSDDSSEVFAGFLVSSGDKGARDAGLMFPPPVMASSAVDISSSFSLLSSVADGRSKFTMRAGGVSGSWILQHLPRFGTGGGGRRWIGAVHAQFQRRKRSTWVRKVPEASGGKFKSVKALFKKKKKRQSKRSAAHPISRTRTLPKQADPTATLPEREKMEGAAPATAVESPAPAAEKTSSYRYWVRETTGDAAPLPAPRKLDATDLAAKAAPATLGSVWNQAGTWEEKNLNSWASSRIKDLLGSLDPLEFSTGKASVYEVSRCSGDAFLVTVRNKKRVGYTYELSLKFKGEWLIKEENKKVRGHLEIPEFSFGEVEDLEVKIMITDDKDLSAADKVQVCKDLKSFVSPIQEKLREFEKELKDR